MKPETGRAGKPAVPLATALAAMAAAMVAVPGPARGTGTAATGTGSGAPADCVGPPSSTWLHVEVERVRSDSGLIAVTLYGDNRSRFLVRRGSLYVGRAPAREGVTRTCIFVPQPGTYALAIYHDEDGNHGFGRTGLGLPAEGYGFSNNPSTLAGLPSFSAVRLHVPRSGLLTRIRMKYP